MSHNTWLALVLVLPLAAHSAIAGEGESPAPPAVSMDDAIIVVQRNFRLFNAQGEDVGRMLLRRGRLRGGGLLREAVTTSRVTVRGADDSVVRNLRISSLASFGADGRLRWIRNIWTEDETVKTLEARFTDARADIELRAPGVRDSRLVDLPANWSTDAQVFRRILPRFLAGEEAAEEYDAINIEALRVDGLLSPRKMVILGQTTFQHGGRRYDAYRVRVEVSGFLITSIVDKEFVPMKMDMGGVMHFDWIVGPSSELPAEDA